METAPLSSEDDALIERIMETNDRTFDSEFFDGAHIVVAGIRMTDGSIYAPMCDHFPMFTTSC